MSLNLRHIEVFHALMHAANMTEAAHRLNVSQPSVSTVLKHAEQRLGMKLFDRAGGRIVPTSEAFALLPEVEQIFERLEALGRSARNLRDASFGIISVGATPTLANVLLAQAVATFARERPDVNVVIRALPGPDIITCVRDHGVDLGLIYEFPTPTPEDLVGEAIHTTQVACVMPVDHPLAARRSVSPKDLAGQRLVTFSPTTPLGAKIDSAFRSERVALKIAVESSISLTSCFIVAAGHGVALVDSAVSVASFPKLVVRPFVPRIENHIIILQRRNRPQSRLAAAFTRTLFQSLTTLT